MTSNQLLTRLPILPAQKKAGNNKQKLNNEIRQIIYSLYSPKNMPKTVYNHLMNSLRYNIYNSLWIRYLLTLKIVKLMNHIDLNCILLIN